MKTSGQQTVCERASAYYYDFLCGQKMEDIPESLWSHIEHCDHCMTEVGRLERAIGPETQNSASESTVAVTASLELHMALLGQPVDCSVARPFLAPMADPLLEVRTSTPVTAHLHECPACGDDLSAIRRLDLTHPQQCRLGQMLAQTGQHDSQLCSAAHEAIPSVAAMQFADVDLLILKHICICPGCRQRLFQHRQKLCDALAPHHRHNAVSCEDIACRDLFDLCLPYRPADEVSPTIVAHVASCRRCTDKLQALLHTMTHIMDRPKSGIVTCLTVADLSRPQAESLSDRGSSQALANGRAQLRAAATKQRPAGLKFRPFIKPLAVAAGILLIAMLVLQGTSLRATDLSEISARLAKINTVHVKRIAPEDSRILQEIWISRNPEVKIFKNGDELTVWDLDKKLRSVKNTITGTEQTLPLDSTAIEQVAATLIGPMHILPFTKLADVPQAATWYRLEDEPADAAVHGADIYEMAWLDKALGGAPVYRKWRGYVQPETRLPVRTEHYSRTDAAAEYELLQVSEIAYPDADSIRDMLR